MAGKRELRHVDPLARHGRLYHGYARLVASPPMTWVSRHVVWKLDPHLMRLTGGRLGAGLTIPTAVLETRGARSGQVRRNSVIYFHDGDLVTIIASKAGAATHPGWLHNARANPDVHLNDQPFRAVVVTDESERERLWSLADRVFPPYATYRARAAGNGRTIPILQLAPG